jgi:hypothetical protein
MVGRMRPSHSAAQACTCQFVRERLHRRQRAAREHNAAHARGFQLAQAHARYHAPEAKARAFHFAVAVAQVHSVRVYGAVRAASALRDEQANNHTRQTPNPHLNAICSALASPCSRWCDARPACGCSSASARW